MTSAGPQVREMKPRECKDLLKEVDMVLALSWYVQLERLAHLVREAEGAVRDYCIMVQQLEVHKPVFHATVPAVREDVGEKVEWTRR